MARLARPLGGYTIVEMLAVMAIVGILAGYGFPRLHQVYVQAQIARAIGDIRAIQIDLMAVESQSFPLPPDLSGVGRGGMLDPWGHPYQYYPFAGNPPGAQRKDRFLVPLNSTFDLYSMGPDGATMPPITAGPSLDDIIRADDGSFIGLASKF